MSRRRRPIRIASVSYRPTAGADGPAGSDAFTKGAEILIQRAARMGSDLVAFTDCYPQLAIDDIFHRAAPSDGGTLDRARERAR